MSDVSARISKKVEDQGRLQSLAAQCAASLEGHPKPNVALMLAFLLGWEARAAEEIARARAQLEAEEAKKRAQGAAQNTTQVVAPSIGGHR